MSDYYSYTEYWKIKREELTKKLAEKTKPTPNKDDNTVNNSLKNLNNQNKELYGVDENYLNEYGYADLFDQPNGEQIDQISTEDKFEIVERGEEWSKIKLENGKIGYINNSIILFN